MSDPQMGPAAPREQRAAARAERREEQSAARAAHVASRFWTYLLATLAGLVVCLVPALWTAYWATWPPCSACSWASSLMWLAEHTRGAWGAGLARRPSAAGWRTARSAGRERAGACISTDA